MERWFFVVVLFGALAADSNAADGFFNGTLARSRREPCRKLYSFRNLDYENLRKSSACESSLQVSALDHFLP